MNWYFWTIFDFGGNHSVLISLKIRAFFTRFSINFFTQLFSILVQHWELGQDESLEATLQSFIETLAFTCIDLQTWLNNP